MKLKMKIKIAFALFCLLLLAFSDVAMGQVHSEHKEPAVNPLLDDPEVRPQSEIIVAPITTPAKGLTSSSITEDFSIGTGFPVVPEGLELSEPDAPFEIASGKREEDIDREIQQSKLSKGQKFTVEEKPE